MMARLVVLIALLVSSLSVVANPFATVFASNLIMARSHEKFPEAMLTLLEDSDE